MGRHRSAAWQLSARCEFVNDLGDVAGEHFCKLIPINAPPFGQLLEFPLAKDILDLPPLNRLVGAGADPRVDLLPHAPFFELFDDIGQTLGLPATEDLTKNLAEVVSGRHSGGRLGGTLLGGGLTLGAGLGCACDHLLENLAEDVHVVAPRSRKGIGFHIMADSSRLRHHLRG